MRLLRGDPSPEVVDVSDSRDAIVLAAISGRRPSRKGWVRANCPFCELSTGKADKKQCLGLRVDTGGWHCFRCGAAGYLHMGEEELAEVANKRPAALTLEEATRAIEPPDGFVPLFEDDDFAGDFFRSYLTGTGRTEDGERKRELPEAVCRAAGIGAVYSGCGSDCRAGDPPRRCIRCRIRGRVVVPILDADGPWLGWSARAVFSSSRKYLYPEDMARADILYNRRALSVETDKPALVVEGVFDALALWPDAVAVLGKPSEPQKEMLRAAARPVVTVMDGDAWREGRALSDWLRFHGRRAGYVRMAPGVDPDEVPRADLERLAAESLEG